jgi:hypothetical protein
MKAPMANIIQSCKNLELVLNPDNESTFTDPKRRINMPSPFVVIIWPMLFLRSSRTDVLTVRNSWELSC